MSAHASPVATPLSKDSQEGSSSRGKNPTRPLSWVSWALSSPLSLSEFEAVHAIKSHNMLPGYSLFHALPYLRFRVENGGIFTHSSETGTPVTTAEAQSFREEVLNTASYYRERLIDYIRNNISSFPEYSTNSGADVSPSTENYYSNMNLDMPRQSDKLTLRDFLTPDLT